VPPWPPVPEAEIEEDVDVALAEEDVVVAAPPSPPAPEAVVWLPPSAWRSYARSSMPEITEHPATSAIAERPQAPTLG
jgi:hypothetical protein